MKFFKFISVVYCFSVPLVVCGADNFSSLAVGETDPNVVFSSSSYATGVYVGNGGISVYDSINVGYLAVSGVGSIYADETTTSPYNFKSLGNVVVGQNLNVANGFGVNVSGYDDSPIDVTFGGNVINNIGAGTIKFENVNNFTASVMQNSGKSIDVSATGDLSLTKTGTTALQNMAGAINLFVGGDIDVAGVIENSNSASPEYDDSGNLLSGMVVKSGGDLTVSGGDESTASVINSGNLYALIGGTTTLARGFNLSGMENDNVFYFETGKLNLGTENDGAFWTNNLNSFVLKLTAGDSVLDAGSVQNGFDNAKYNENANMSLYAETINAQSVKNNAQSLLLSADADIDIAGNIENIKGVARINASNTINAASVVNNDKMYISGTKGIVLDYVYNNGMLLNVSTDTATGSNLSVAQTITNDAGETTIAANDITVGGLVTSGGTSAADKLNIIGKGLVEFGGIRVDGGIFTLDALTGSVVAGGDTSGGIFVDDGALNLGTSLSNLNVSGDVIIDGKVTLSGTSATGNGDVNISAYGVTKTNIISGGKIVVDDGIFANANDASRLAVFDSDTIIVGTDDNKADVSVSNGNGLIFGNSDSETSLSISGDLSVADGGSVDILSKNTVADSVVVGDAALILRGESIVANTNDITISNGIWSDNLNHNSGVSIVDTNTFSINGNSDIIVSSNGINVVSGNNLSLVSGANVDVTGLVDISGMLNVDVANNIVFNNNVFVDTDANIKLFGQNINAENANLSVNGTMDIYGTSGSESNAASVNFADIITSGNTKVNANNIVVGNTAQVNAGQFVVNGANVTADLFDAAGGRSELNLSGALNVTDLVVSDNLYQASGAGTNGLWLLGNSTLNASGNAHVKGDVIADSGDGVYNVANRFDIDGDLSVANGAKSSFVVGDLSAGSIDNTGILSLKALNRIDASLLNNSKNMVIDASVVALENFATDGVSVFKNTNLISVENSADISVVLYQNKNDVTDEKYMNVISDNYRFSAGVFESGGVYQNSGKMWIDSGDVTVNGNVIAGDLTIGSDSEYLTAFIDGNVSAGVHFKNVQRLNISGDYDFSSNSSFSGIVLSEGQIPGSYWSHIDSDGIVTNAAAGAPLVSVGGTFNFDLSTGTDVIDWFSDSQMRLTLFDVADVDDAIWLVNAGSGVKNADDIINNFYVRYCNSDGSICVDYPDIANLIQRNIITDTNLYHDVYVTFDPSWSIAYIQKIQPVVGGVPGHSDSEYSAAGTLDDVIEKQLHVKGFYNKTPSSLLPVIFGGTNLYDVSVALNERMNAYLNQRDGRIYQRFSRLFDARDAEQALGNVVLNEHTYFRNFEDRMIDEFLWNRNRNLNKAWLDVDYGFYNQSVSENIDADGSRFGLSAGFDWRQDKGLILGLSAHFNHLKSDANDSFDVSYLPSESIAGHVDTSVTDNNIGIGAYMMQNLGVSTRLYGNAFLDLHMFDIDRDQNYVSGITGDGTAFSIISEWGLLHDWLNQYITGNLYARVGYNTGLDITEKSAGSDYMDMTSDGYAILTPGYTLTAQKRIYPSSWFQIRPYASVGAEYDVLGAPDQIKYKFAIADKYTDYDVEINPLWINAGAGVELVSATGFQFGLDYRYQHNSDIQLHNFKLSGSYRF